MFSSILVTLGFIDMMFAGWLVGENSPGSAAVAAVCGLYLCYKAITAEARERK